MNELTTGNQPKSELTLINEQLPDFMRNEAQTGTENLRQYIRPPRVKIVQSQSLGIFADNYQPGDVLLVPQMIQLLAYDRKIPANNRVWFTPLFFFTEWTLTNDIKLRGVEPFIVEKTSDPKSMIARRARSQNERERAHPTNPQCKQKYVEFLNYVSILHIGGIETTPVVLSFANAEHKSGETLAAHILMRRVPNTPVQAPLYGCIFQAQLGERSNNKGKWIGWDVVNPTIDSGFPPFIIDVDLFNVYKQLHTELLEAFQAQLLDIEYEDTEVSTQANAESTAF